jgi:hypothetical protein
VETSESGGLGCEFCGHAGSWLLTYPILATAGLAVLFLVLFRKSLWKQFLFVGVSTLTAFLMFVWSFHDCGGLQHCPGSGPLILFLGTPLSLVNIALITLLTFFLAVLPAERHGVLGRLLQAGKA